MSSPPPASPPMVWPPSNPTGTVIPFPLPWGQTGCCPPGGMDALMKCYCDIQQASAFIGQIMLDQINNNPAITEAIIAAIEKSGSSLPTLGVTNGSNAQPGQVGEYVEFIQTGTPTVGTNAYSVTLGVLQPGDWDCTLFGNIELTTYTAMFGELNPSPVGFSNQMAAGVWVDSGQTVAMIAENARASISVPTLVVYGLNITASAVQAGSIFGLTFQARRAR